MPTFQLGCTSLLQGNVWLRNPRSYILVRLVTDLPLFCFLADYWEPILIHKFLNTESYMLHCNCNSLFVVVVAVYVAVVFSLWTCHLLYIFVKTIRVFDIRRQKLAMKHFILKVRTRTWEWDENFINFPSTVWSNILCWRCIHEMVLNAIMEQWIMQIYLPSISTVSPFRIRLFHYYLK